MRTISGERNVQESIAIDSIASWQAPDRVAVEGLHPQTEKQAFGCRTAFETELRVFA